MVIYNNGNHRFYTSLILAVDSRYYTMINKTVN